MNFWKGKKVFITGHTGFKGSWLSLFLQKLDAEVIGFSLAPPTTPNLFTRALVAESMVSIIADIRDYDALHQALKKHQPELIFHLAAQPLVRYSYQEPIETFSTNIMGTVHLLEAARNLDSVRAIVNVTTDKCYKNKESFWPYRETDELGGHDPYSSSKACSELVTHAYHASYFANRDLGLATARAGNVIGGGDWAADRLIPDIIGACIRQEPCRIRSPHAKRPWQHVLEPLSAYLLLAEKLVESPERYSGAWNFGPEEADIKTVSWIADYIVKSWGPGARWINQSKDDLHETLSLKLDSRKANQLLGWKPRWSLERGLQETILWYQAASTLSNMRALCEKQIHEFAGMDVKPSKITAASLPA